MTGTRDTLPDFAKVCASDGSVVLMHQSAFGCEDDELRLLGMALKYAGMMGKEVRIIPASNTETKYELRAALMLAGRRIVKLCLWPFFVARCRYCLRGGTPQCGTPLAINAESELVPEARVCGPMQWRHAECVRGTDIGPAGEQ